MFYLGINIGYIAIMALPMTFVVMTGEIDLSVASMLGPVRRDGGLPVASRLGDLAGVPRRARRRLRSAAR